MLVASLFIPFNWFHKLGQIGNIGILNKRKSFQNNIHLLGSKVFLYLNQTNLSVTDVGMYEKVYL